MVLCAMKTQPHLNTRTDRRTNGDIRWLPPPIQHRRYPSAYEDFEPLRQRNRPTRRITEENPTNAGYTEVESNLMEFPYVRVFALLAIVAIMAALAATT